VPVGVLDSGPMPVPPVPSSTLARDLLALVPGGRAMAAASLRAPPGGEEREAALEAAVRGALGVAPAPPPRAPQPPRHPSLRYADFALRVGAHELPTHAWLLRAVSPLFQAVVAECEAAGRGEASPRSRRVQLALQEGGVEGGGGGEEVAGAVSLATAVRLLAFCCAGVVMVTPGEPAAAMALLAAADELALHELACAAEACLVSCVGDDSVLGLLQWADSFLAAHRGEGEGVGDGGGGEGGGGMALEGAGGGAAPQATSLRREGRTGSLLHAACLSHLLREYARLTASPDFELLAPHLRAEVARAYESQHAYLGDRDSR
jgi:hypothetical protein